MRVAIWLMAGLLASGGPGPVASDGQPPVTIIEIPVDTTTTTTQPSTTTSEAVEVAGTVVSVPTSSQVSEPTAPTMTPPVLVVGRWDWPLLVVITAVLGTLSVISLSLVRRVFNREVEPDDLGNAEGARAKADYH
jgi:hypothetical protein